MRSARFVVVPESASALIRDRDRRPAPRKIPDNALRRFGDLITPARDEVFRDPAFGISLRVVVTENAPALRHPRPWLGWTGASSDSTEIPYILRMAASRAAMSNELAETSFLGNA